MSDLAPRSVTQELGNALVALHKEQFGRGPARVSVPFAGEDGLLIVLEEALLPAEVALVAAGEGLRVVETRMAFQTATADVFVEIIERITGRKVRSFTSAIDASERIAYEICLFEPRETAL